MIARIACDPVNRGEVRDTASLFDAKVIDLGTGSITFEVTGSPAHLGAFLDHMSGYGVVDLVKSGRIAMRRESDLSPTAATARVAT
jgi:acetolactate synthase-1/3 small subunit